jgi:hypothetical protein
MNEKSSRHSPFLIVSEAAQNLSFFIGFYRFLSFVLSFSKETEENDKNYQRMMKSDKKMIKNEKNSRHSPFLIVSEAAQNLSFFLSLFYRFFSSSIFVYHFFIIFLIIFSSSIFVYPFLSFFIIFSSSTFVYHFFIFSSSIFGFHFYHFFIICSSNLAEIMFLPFCG